MSSVPKILIVDDEPRMCESLKTLLMPHCYEVDIANNGKQAIGCLAQKTFDIVLLDIVMPDMDGQQVLDYVRDQRPETLVIAITGQASMESAVAALRHGAYDYLSKPFEHEELLRRIRNALERNRLKREHRRTEKALRESEERYRRITEAVTDYIFTVRIKSGRAVETIHSPTCVSVTGYSPEEYASDPGLWIRMVHAEDRDIVWGQARRVIAGQEAPPIEHRIFRKDGVMRWVRNTLVPHYDAQGKLLSYDGLIRDIDERKKAEEAKAKLEARLRQVDKMEAIGTLAGGIAHDFNNLLMAMQGAISLMLTKIDSLHPHYKYLKGLEKQVQSGAMLTRQLLGYARKGKYQVTPLDLNQLLRETSETFGRTRKEITIRHELAEDLFTIEADRGQIVQLLLNLYVNAADAMPGGGNLIVQSANVTHEDIKGKIYTPKPGNYALLTVTDTGTGMDKETLERIFDPFFTTKDIGMGTGLGLASAYGIIKSHGGYIDVESGKGHGTSFYIYLPGSEKKVKDTAKTVDQLVQGRETILIVDDEAMILDVGAEMLKELGYTVLNAKSGIEAVEIYEANKNEIDLVILDMVMPGMGGGLTYDKMKEIDPDARVLLSSGYSLDGQAREILERGCKGFMQKPFNINELSRKVREILDEQ
jgi:two-component system cell cycle sensor histidine kinase/response regulator CckA